MLTKRLVDVEARTPERGTIEFTKTRNAKECYSQSLPARFKQAWIYHRAFLTSLTNSWVLRRNDEFTMEIPANIKPSY